MSESDFPDLTPEEQASLKAWQATPPPPGEGAPETRHILHGGLIFRAPKSLEDRSQLCLIEPDEGGFRANIMVALEPTILPLDAYAKKQMAEIRAAVPEAEVVEDLERHRVERQDRMQAVIRMPREGKPPVLQLQAFFVHEGQAHTFTCTAEEASFAGARERMFDPALESVRFVKAAPAAAKGGTSGRT